MFIVILWTNLLFFQQYWYIGNLSTLPVNPVLRATYSGFINSNINNDKSVDACNKSTLFFYF